MGKSPFWDERKTGTGKRKMVNTGPSFAIQDFGLDRFGTIEKLLA
jgi:hypothetical protein